jgi:hypothetical protein
LNALSHDEWDALRRETLAYVDTLREYGGPRAEVDTSGPDEMRTGDRVEARER